jgi:hypothetical protein
MGRFVDSLQERIKLLESQLEGLRSTTVTRGQVQSDGGKGSSDQDRDHSAAALSALAGVLTPIASAINCLSITKSEHHVIPRHKFCTAQRKRDIRMG